MPTQCNSFTRFYLALLGQIGYDECPCVPPELVLIPSRLELQPERDVGLDADDRRAAVDHVVFQAGAVAAAEHGHRRAVPRRPAAGRRGVRPGWFSWTNFFLGVDRVLKWLDRWVPAAWRRPAIEAAHRWMLEHCENTDGLGAIFPPMVYSIIALRVPGLRRRIRRPCSWAMRAARRPADRRGRPGPGPAVPLAGLGHGDRHDRAGRRQAARRPSGLGRAVDWLLAKEVRGSGRLGDSTARASSRPAGTSSSTTSSTPTSTTARWWCSRLQRSPLADDPAVEAATRRGVNWLLAMQNRDGGWAAYDVDIDNQVLTKLPFADHNAMLDPSCADITARVARAARHARLSRRPSLDRAAPSITSGAPRSPRAAGTAAGASTTSTAPGRSCRG